MHMKQAMKKKKKKKKEKKRVLYNMRTIKVQISLRIRVFWSAPLLFAA